MTFISPFPPEIRTASIVPRWSVVWTLNRDTVANHSFYVALYADAIANLIGWKGNRGDLLYLALTHDLDETVSGDIVSPVKREIVDRDRFQAYVDRKMTDRMPSVMARLEETSEDGATIVKAADCLDAVLFLTVEERMGNKHIESRTPGAIDNLRNAWYRLPWPKEPTEKYLGQMFNDVVLPAIDEHKTNGGSGV